MTSKLHDNSRNRHIVMMCRLFLIFYSVSAYSHFVVTNTRGFRNNNPGNIEIGEQWDGLSSHQKDKRFATFKSEEYGIRAIGKILDTYRYKYGVTSVSGILNRWAPSRENSTDKYIRFVNHYINKRCNKCSTQRRKVYIIEAIIKYENGFQPFNHRFIEQCLKK